MIVSIVRSVDFAIEVQIVAVVGSIGLVGLVELRPVLANDY